MEVMEKIEDGQEVYRYVDAEMVHPRRWSDDALFAMGAILARLHRTGAAFDPGEESEYRPWCLREIGSDHRIWCHGDIAPWNILTKDELPYVLVDWEYAGPLDPFVELARVCWLFVQLHDDDLQQLHDLPSPEKRAQQLRLICDGYGLEQEKRMALVDQIIEVIICETAHEAIDQNISFDDAGDLWGFAWRTRSLYWVWRHRAVLEEALHL